HRAIARAVDEQGPPEVNVDIGSPTPFWDNMWVIYFIEGRRIHSVRPTYVTVSSPDAAWTVRWRAERPPPGEERVAVHGRFALDRVVSLGPR
ncbi:MAG TPA: hypothetical protein VFV35_06595, partial [Acidimicrobiales bacterium]|nr:hypothetical protein [Acidimicrobiales bacterium]